jgi:hypothetical protein
MKSKKTAVSAGLAARPAPKPSLEDLEAFGGSPATPAPSAPKREKADKVAKAQITLHIPLELEKQLRDDYNAQPAGSRGRFSEFVLRRWGVIGAEDRP